MSLNLCQFFSFLINIKPENKNAFVLFPESMVYPNVMPYFIQEKFHGALLTVPSSVDIRLGCGFQLKFQKSDLEPGQVPVPDF